MGNGNRWLHTRGHFLHQCDRSRAKKYRPDWVLGPLGHPHHTHRAHTVPATPLEDFFFNIHHKVLWWAFPGTKAPSTDINLISPLILPGNHVGLVHT